jgi:RNA polymerase sigma factor (sigma-70 family)
VDQERRCKEALVKANIGLVIKIAATFHKSSDAPIADLKQEGAIGLLKAIDGFDPSKGMQFSSYAVPKIRGEILHYLRDRAPLMRVPRPYWDAYKAVAADQKSLEKQGYMLSMKSIAMMKGKTEEEWREISIACTARISDAAIDLPAGRSEESVDAGEVFGALSKLSDRDRSIFVSFAMRSEGRSVADIAVHYGESETDVQAVIDRSRQILKAQLV